MTIRVNFQVLHYNTLPYSFSFLALSVRISRWELVSLRDARLDLSDKVTCRNPALALDLDQRPRSIITFSFTPRRDNQAYPTEPSIRENRKSGITHPLAVLTRICPFATADRRTVRAFYHNRAPSTYSVVQARCPVGCSEFTLRSFSRTLAIHFPPKVLP